jgi:hypothetical protein
LTNTCEADRIGVERDRRLGQAQHQLVPDSSMLGRLASTASSTTLASSTALAQLDPALIDAAHVHQVSIRRDITAPGGR